MQVEHRQNGWSVGMCPFALEEVVAPYQSINFFITQLNFSIDMSFFAPDRQDENRLELKK